MKKRDVDRAIVVKGVSIPVEKIEALTDTQRWAYYLLGFIANEMGSILRLLGHSLDAHGDQRRFRHMPELIQSSMLFRLAAGKAFEAMLQLRTGEFRSVFKEIIEQHLEDANARWSEVNTAFNNATWLGALRNGGIFHYPKLSDWKDITKPNENWENDQFYFSEGPYSIFFDASEVIGQNWTLSTISKNAPPATKEEAQKRYEQLIDTTINLATLLQKFVVDSATVIIADHFFQGNPPTQELGTVKGPAIDSIKIPVWTYKRPDRH